MDLFMINHAENFRVIQSENTMKQCVNIIIYNYMAKYMR